MIEKRTYLALLFDFYSSLLTDKQRLFFDLYYNNDLSLGEIAEEYQVSRQAVFDNIKRVEMLLFDYENKLSLVAKFLKIKAKLDEALILISNMEQTDETISKLIGILQAVARENY